MTDLDQARLQRVAAAVNYDNGSAIQMARYSHEDVKWLVAELSARTVDPCEHSALSGDEGPIEDLGGLFPVRWRCDGCGAIRYDDDQLSKLRAEARRLEGDLTVAVEEATRAREESATNRERQQPQAATELARSLQSEGGRSETELIRTSGGNVIHRATCRYAHVHPVPWQWAEGREYVQIRMAAVRFRYKLCKVCKPAEGAGTVGVLEDA